MDYKKKYLKYKTLYTTTTHNIYYCDRLELYITNLHIITRCIPKLNELIRNFFINNIKECNTILEKINKQFNTEHCDINFNATSDEFIKNWLALLYEYIVVRYASENKKHYNNFPKWKDIEKYIVNINLTNINKECGRVDGTLYVILLKYCYEMINEMYIAEIIKYCTSGTQKLIKNTFINQKKPVTSIIDSIVTKKTLKDINKVILFYDFIKNHFISFDDIQKEINIDTKNNTFKNITKRDEVCYFVNLQVYYVSKKINKYNDVVEQIDTFITIFNNQSTNIQHLHFPPPVINTKKKSHWCSIL